MPLRQVRCAVVDALSKNGAGADRARGLALALLALLAVTSLLAAVPGMLARNRRTYAWATLCVTPHFIYALTELVANPSIRVLAASMLVLGLALVVALVAYLRLTRAEDR